MMLQTADAVGVLDTARPARPAGRLWALKRIVVERVAPAVRRPGTHTTARFPWAMPSPLGAPRGCRAAHATTGCVISPEIAVGRRLVLVGVAAGRVCAAHRRRRTSRACAGMEHLSSTLHPFPCLLERLGQGGSVCSLVKCIAKVWPDVPQPRPVWPEPAEGCPSAGTADGNRGVCVPERPGPCRREPIESGRVHDRPRAVWAHLRAQVVDKNENSPYSSVSLRASCVGVAQGVSSRLGLDSLHGDYRRQDRSTEGGGATAMHCTTTSSDKSRVPVASGLLASAGLQCGWRGRTCASRP